MSEDEERLSGLGLLTVFCRRGTSLLAADSNGLSDPYLIVSALGQTRRTRVIKKTLNPQWDESLGVMHPPDLS